MIRGLYEAHLPVRDLSVSIPFYKKLGLEVACQNEKLVFFWIERGKSWLGLWETDKVDTPYHPSLRHIAFQVDEEEIEKTKAWLEEIGIEVRTAFGFSPEQQPLVFPNPPHAAIYFDDPDGNSLELITPLKTNNQNEFQMMTLKEWEEISKEVD